ncbi:hypothetical protein L596_026511 [Steinernema carpocapsae]|uniref:Uncharacterized protein n=1 Tax=Steinernema carpocapsae TaxID=34508 RepID=A0A4U5M1N3_STECR|nr:hypothetical protein L596_026511 [Steinernema carpocapsae]
MGVSLPVLLTRHAGTKNLSEFLSLADGREESQSVFKLKVILKSCSTAELKSDFALDTCDFHITAFAFRTLPAC